MIILTLSNTNLAENTVLALKYILTTHYSYQCFISISLTKIWQFRLRFSICCRPGPPCSGPCSRTTWRRPSRRRSTLRSVWYDAKSGDGGWKTTNWWNVDGREGGERAEQDTTTRDCSFAGPAAEGSITAAFKPCSFQKLYSPFFIIPRRVVAKDNHNDSKHEIAAIEQEFITTSIGEINETSDPGIGLIV